MKARWLFALFGALAFGALAADWMTRDPGYVLLTWGDYALETSLGVAALALFVLTLSAAATYASARGIVRAVRQIAEWTAELNEPDTDAKRRRLGSRARRLLEHGQHGALRRRLDKALPAIWEPTLLDCYGLVRDADLPRRLRSATAWLAEHPNDASLLLCLGRLCMRCARWDEAGEYLARSLKAEPTPAACAELARVEAHRGNQEASQALLRRGLALSAGPLADMPS